jgi:hypothetical protein
MSPRDIAFTAGYQRALRRLHRLTDRLTDRDTLGTGTAYLHTRARIVHDVPSPCTTAPPSEPSPPPTAPA